MTLPFALIGMTGLWLLFAWLLCAIAASWISERKGYGQRGGIAAGLLLMPIGIIIWLFIPPRPGSVWKEEGAMPHRRQEIED